MSETLTVILPPPARSRPRRVLTVRDGAVVETDASPSPCPNCRKLIEPDAPIRKVFTSWLHDACARDVITNMGVSQSWLMLATQLAARPSSFKVSETKAIVRALIEMCEQPQDESGDVA